MERKLLEDQGLSKEIVDQIMDAHSADIGELKNQITSLTTERDTIKAQFADVKKKLDDFKGVDVSALQGEIDTLKSDLATKQTEFQAQIAERDFQSALNTAILTAKGRNAKAIIASLDLEKLKESKNQSADFAAALEELKKSDAYLFEEAKTDGTPAIVSTGGKHTDESGTSASTNATMNALFRSKLKGEQ